MTELVGRTVGIEEVSIEALTPHPQNAFFFPELASDDLVDSIKDHGVIEAPIVTTSNVIISGHRRISVLKRLGVKSVMCQIREYDNEDAMTYDLIAANVTGRGGVAGLDPVYVSRIVYELNRLNGSLGTQRTPIVGDGKTQEEICSELGISRSAAQRALQGNRVSVPLQDEMQKEGIATEGALVAVSKLSEEQQEVLHQMLVDNKLEKATTKRLKEFVAELQNRAAEAADLERRLEKQTQRANMFADAARNNDIGQEIEARLKAEANYNRIKAQMMSIKDKALESARASAHEIEDLKKQLANKTVVEVAPDDYEDLKAECEMLSSKVKQLSSYDALMVATSTSIYGIFQAASDIKDETLETKMKTIKDAADDLQEYIKTVRQEVIA